MATENKTKPTHESATAFLNKITDKQVREDCFVILEMMQKVSKYDPVMWGSAIVGFGKYHYVYESGREGLHPAKRPIVRILSKSRLLRVRSFDSELFLNYFTHWVVRMIVVPFFQLHGYIRAICSTKLLDDPYCTIKIFRISFNPF